MDCKSAFLCNLWNYIPFLNFLFIIIFFISFLVGGPWKSNVVLKKWLPFFYEPWKSLQIKNKVAAN